MMIHHQMPMVILALHGMIAMSLQDHMAALVAMTPMTLLLQSSAVHVRTLIEEMAIMVTTQELILIN